ncbi:bestrophin-4-like isoform X2 [Onthophagus taurus]|uniref:bestrophin-4-like isoform X2 n=1 Tax=Onthophagus taurus TaxID=166361 RepID=UPI0039BE2158
MTVTYTAEVATSRLGCFLKLLTRWRGSIYKLVWFELTIFLVLYYFFSILYRCVLVYDENAKSTFENIVKYCKGYMDLIPISFVLGFYVSIVMTRWWNQYTTIPFPDPLAVFVSSTIHGMDEGGRMMRRTIMRYVCLCITIMFTGISPRVKKRFPSLDHLVEAGLLQDSEREIITDLNAKFPKYSKYWMPIVWAASIITRARKEGRIRDDFAVKTMLDELNKLRGKCGLLLSFDTISVPLVYTQVVTLAVYTYFLTTLMGHQFIDTSDNNYFNMYLPIFTLLQFFFYMGWLKVAESLINPFGDDDDDFEINWMIDRNLQVSYLIVDEMHHSHPELVRDQYWDQVFPAELPYTLAAEPFRESHPLPSTANIAVYRDDILPPTSVKVDDNQIYSDMNSGIMFTAKPSHLKRGTSQSSNIGTTVPDSISRVSSVTNMLKKIFNRENSRTESEPQRESPIELAPGTSVPTTPKTIAGSPGTANQVLLKPGATKLTDQVIEEVDEQTTITSMKGANDLKPTVFNVFGVPARSQPISVPQQLNKYDDISHDPFSKSAPEGDEEKDQCDNISIGSATDEDSEEDAFTRLRRKRLQERRSRLMLSLGRSLSSNVDFNEHQNLIDRSPTSPQYIRSTSQRDNLHDHADILLYEKMPPEHK